MSLDHLARPFSEACRASASGESAHQVRKRRATRLYDSRPHRTAMYCTDTNGGERCGSGLDDEEPRDLRHRWWTAGCSQVLIIASIAVAPAIDLAPLAFRWTTFADTGRLEPFAARGSFGLALGAALRALFIERARDSCWAALHRQLQHGNDPLGGANAD